MSDYIDKLVCGDARNLSFLPNESIQTCVTSPPYFGLRDYEVEPSVWGGDPTCDHEWTESLVYNDRITRKVSAQRFVHADGTNHNAVTVKEGRWKRDTVCSKCGAWFGCLGLETDVEQYVSNMRDIFREVYRVLRKDGTLWLNIGDSYNGSGGAGGDYNAGGGKAKRTKYPGRRVPGLKPKDLILVPWRLAIALQADGWYVRSDIVWHKTPRPEAPNDRPVTAHEYVLLLSKSARYFYDWQAIADVKPDGAPKRRCDVWNVRTATGSSAHGARFDKDLVTPCILAGSREGDTVLDIFCGSGTTCATAKRLGRHYVGIDLKPEFVDLAKTNVT